MEKLTITSEGRLKHKGKDVLASSIGKPKLIACKSWEDREEIISRNALIGSNAYVAGRETPIQSIIKLDEERYIPVQYYKTNSSL